MKNFVICNVAVLGGGVAQADDDPAEVRLLAEIFALNIRVNTITLPRNFIATCVRHGTY